MSEVLYLKYRPAFFDDVVGHDEVVSSIKKLLKEGRAHSFLFEGPAGVGKTTLARLIANEVLCAPKNLQEIDAATHSGVEAMRSITSTLNYAGLGKSPIRVIIMDEAHALSNQAWQSLLKSVEEPPIHVYWIFCTTESKKIPKTIRTRCASFTLPPIPTKLMLGPLAKIAGEEKIKVGRKIVEFVARSAHGSLREAIKNLALCDGCETVKEASKVLAQADEGDTNVIDLCRALLNGNLTWEKAMELLRSLEGMDPESIRIVVTSYFAKVAMGSKGGRAASALSILECFSEPYPRSPNLYPVLLSLGELLLGE
jgi:DNA polymerase-3 subunit gamma/tau